MEQKKLGSPQHCLWVLDFVNFETFGTMGFNHACENANHGYLKVSEIMLAPSANVLTVIELTAKGRDVSKKLHEIWKDFYEPVFINEVPNWEVPDPFTLSDTLSELVGFSQLALSRERFETERKAGKLNEIIKRCPPIVDLDL